MTERLVLRPGPTDAERIATFRQFLAETPTGLLHDLGHAPDHFPTRLAFEAWRTRWMAYLVGLAEGPTDADQYRALRHRVLASRTVEAEWIDRFHT